VVVWEGKLQNKNYICSKKVGWTNLHATDAADDAIITCVQILESHGIQNSNVQGLVTFCYKAGKQNVVADCLSRLESDDKPPQ